MADRLRRFLNLERPRADLCADAEPAGTAERIEALERPGKAPAAPRTSGADLERFVPAPDPPIELVETSAAERPFTRCMRCGMDHNVFAVECAGCGASLDTDAQREFNERLWAARQEDQAREARASEERRRLEARTEADLDAQRRAMGELLAREVGERERRKLWMRGAPGGIGSEPGYGGPPLGLRLLRALPDWRWQLAAIAGAVAIVGGLAAFGASGHPLALLGAIGIAVVLVVPQRRTDGW